MKKTLLFTLAMVFAVVAFSQKNVRLDAQKVSRTDAATLIMKSVENQNSTPIFKLAPQNFRNPGVGGELEAIRIGTTQNIWGHLLEDQRCMYYDVTSGITMSTRRGDHATPGFSTGNDIVAAYSTDGGLTWTDTEAYVNEGKPARYPSGVLFNPNSSTNAEDVYSVVAGPMHSGGTWSDTYFASKTLGGENYNTKSIPTGSAELVRTSMLTTTDGKVRIGNNNSTYGSGHIYTNMELDLFTGTWNATSNEFDWEKSIIDPLPTIHQESPGSYLGSSEFCAAFSKDGQIGYIITLGQDIRGGADCPVTFPITWMTEDAGETWNMLDFFDFGSCPALYPILRDLGNEPGRVLPIFEEYYSDGDSRYFGHEIDAVVDARGNLHLFAMVASKYSTHPDSLSWGWVNEKHPIFEFEFDKGNNTWGAAFVDTLNTFSVGPKTSTLRSSNPAEDGTGWNHRLQAAVSEDGLKVFCTWTDTDVDFFTQPEFPYYDLNPDLRIWSRDINTGMSTGPINLTHYTAGFGESHFHHLSPIVPNVDGDWHVPVSFINIAENGSIDDLPLPIDYLKGIVLTEDDYIYAVNVDNSSPMLANKVSECYPNPAKNNTNINLNIDRTANVFVSVRTMTGQTVYTNDFGRMNAGHNTVTINTNNLAKGMYIVNVTIGGEQHTKKLIVR
ncbi:MAG: T9SS type A sorting domain-containing protein [Bacteroidales bacterium]|jgi:hypothetical protein